MTEITNRRLENQLITASSCRQPGEVVAVLVAMQAQDYAGVLWSVGLRLPDATEADVETAITERKIVRTWPMRGTLHLVASADVHWMLDLLAPQIIAGRAHLARQLELDASTLARCEKLFVHEMRVHRQLTRETLMKLLERNKISTANQRGYHILWWLAHEKVICFGPRLGKQHTFVLLDEWIPARRKLERDEALAEIALRYFAGHGPATLQDFATWTGLNAADARTALDSVATRLSRETMLGKDYWMPCSAAKVSQTSLGGFLLPGFDEYLLGYRDRGAVLDSRHAQKVVVGANGRFAPTIVLNGRVIGTWQRTITRKALTIAFYPFKRLKNNEKRAIAPAAARYEQFLGLPTEVLD